jgi:hypothetical protein
MIPNMAKSIFAADGSITAEGRRSTPPGRGVSKDAGNPVELTRDKSGEARIQGGRHENQIDSILGALAAS